jgi:hypothetical protein
MPSLTQAQPRRERGLLEYALEAWYERELPRMPRARSDAVADDYGVSPALLWKYTQLDFNRRVEAY